jgi:hypothetical protein
MLKGFIYKNDDAIKKHPGADRGRERPGVFVRDKGLSLRAIYPLYVRG